MAQTAALRYDPTRTTMLRKRWMAEFRKRFLRLRGEILRLVVDEDAFGLKPRHKSIAFNTRFAFRSNADKVAAFSEWLQGQVDEGILETTGEGSSAWTVKHTESAFSKGMGRAFDQVRKSELAESLDFYNGTRHQFLQQAFATDIAVDKLRLLQTRAFTDLKGITQAMDTQITRVLSDSLARGDNPREVARRLNNRVDKIGKSRALTLARTETVRAHNEGQLVALEQLGVEEVGVMVEWSTALDDRVCLLCADLEAVVMTIKEASGIMPRHANCRCAWIPANVGESQVGQKRTKTAIRSAFDSSIRKEGSGTLEDRKERTSWLGSDVSISKVRPKQLVTEEGKPKKKTAKTSKGPQKTPNRKNSSLIQRILSRKKKKAAAATSSLKSKPVDTDVQPLKAPKPKGTPRPKPSKPKVDSKLSTAKDPELRARDIVLNDPEVLKGLKVPPKLYHVTSRSRLAQIQKQGLKAAKRSSTEGEQLGIYLTDNPMEIIEKQVDIAIARKDMVVLKVKTKNIPVRLDPEYFYWDDVSKSAAKEYVEDVNDRIEELAVYTRENIPASAIKVSKAF